MEQQKKLVIYDHDDTLLTCDIKSVLVSCLSTVYKLEVTGPPKNPIECWAITNHIKNYDGIILVWNNLKPTCSWVIDLCKRYNKEYAIVERNLLPTQQKDSFMLFSGGICFDSTNLDPKYFSAENYQENMSKIYNHYSKNNLRKLKSKKKIVFIGQLVWDSTMTHFYSANDPDNIYDEIIDDYIKDNKINTDEYQIIFCPHPIIELRLKDKIKEYPVCCNLPKKYEISTKETIKECLDAEKVVSVSSSIIYEIMGLGIDVEILGKGKGVFPALREWDDLNHCLSTIMDFQFNVKDNPEKIKNIINRAVLLNKGNK